MSKKQKTVRQQITELIASRCTNCFAELPGYNTKGPGWHWITENIGPFCKTCWREIESVMVGRGPEAPGAGSEATEHRVAEVRALVVKSSDLLTPQQIRRIGALQVEDIRDLALDQFVEQQRAIYDDCSRETLIQTLCDRDRSLASEGRAMANGQTGKVLLREFVRGVLAAADNADPLRFEKTLAQLGAPPADARQIRLHGTTLGTGQSSEERRLELEANIVVPKE